MKELLLFLAGLGLSLFTLKYSPQLKAFVKKARLEQEIYEIQKRLTNDPREAEMIAESVYEREYEGLNEQEKDQLLDDDQLVYETQEKLAFQFTEDTLKANQEMVIAAINEIGGFILEYTNASMRTSREIVLHAVAENGLALEYADESFKADREIVLTAVETDGGAFFYADESLKNDRDIILAALRREGNYTSADVLKEATKDARYKWDRGVVAAAVYSDGLALQYADESLKTDREIVLMAVEENGLALQYADESLKADLEIVLAAVKKNVTPSGYRFGNYCDNSYALQYADESLKADLDIVLVSIQENGRNALKHADDCLKRDPQIMKAVFKKSKLRLKKS